MSHNGTAVRVARWSVATHPDDPRFVPLEDHAPPDFHHVVHALLGMARRLPATGHAERWTALARECKRRGITTYGAAFERLALEMERS